MTDATRQMYGASGAEGPRESGYSEVFNRFSNPLVSVARTDLPWGFAAGLGFIPPAGFTCVVRSFSAFTSSLLAGAVYLQDLGSSAEFWPTNPAALGIGGYYSFQEGRVVCPEGFQVLLDDPTDHVDLIVCGYLLTLA